MLVKIANAGPGTGRAGAGKERIRHMKVRKEKTLATKMAISLVAGLTAGLLFLFLREHLNSSGQEAVWTTINDLLFQDITAAGASSALGLFYLAGQMFIRALQLVIVPMVFTSITLAIGQISDTSTLGRISFKCIKGFLICSFFALLLACVCGIVFYNMGVFHIAVDGLESVSGSAGSNPLLVVLNVIPSNIASTFSSNTAVLAVVFLAVSLGLCMKTLGEEKTEVVCDGISADIAATAKCLSALGAKIEEMETGFLVSPIKKVPEGRCDLYCGESGSTLRFLLPIVGALGAQAVFHREGRLPQRPLAPLDSVLKEHGMTLREDGDLLYCSGQLIGGNYTIAGNVSSQYISGLLMALPLLIRDSLLMVSGPLESAAYVAMTEDALQLSKLTIPKMGAMWAIPGQQRCHLPKRTVVEGDWSNTAFFLCMGALSKEGVTVEGLNLQSSQGDRGVLDVLRRFGAEVTEHGDAVTVKRGALHGVTIDAAPIPDLIPVLSVVASVAEGETRVENAYRLRLKESDRLKSTANLLRALGGQVEEKEDGLVITGVPALHGGAVETQNDHRLAMSAATAACAATGEITVDNDGCVAKSYPRFWEDFSSLKGEGL